jgi:hypothetical protein
MAGWFTLSQPQLGLNAISVEPLFNLGSRGPKEEVSRTQRGPKEDPKRRQRGGFEEALRRNKNWSLVFNCSSQFLEADVTVSPKKRGEVVIGHRLFGVRHSD